MSDEPETTADNGTVRDDKGRFGPGNPGRPKGSRHKLGEAFVQALYADFEEHGAKVIETVRTEKPDAYMKVVASLLPKEFKIETVSELTDEQLNARIAQLADVIHRVEGGIGLPAGGGQAPEGPTTAH